MKVITRALVEQVSAEARQNPRLRKNHNIHPSDESRCHRLLNGIEPESYITPHRHLDPEKDEAFIILSGRLGIVTFTDEGDVADLVVLSLDSGNLAADISPGVFHTALSLESGTVFYETKAGPYLPLSRDEIAPWAPEAASLQAEEFLRQLRSRFD